MTHASEIAPARAQVSGESAPRWLTVTRGDAPLVLSIPHSGLELPPELEPRILSSWLARRDADFWVDRLYDFAHELDATVVRTRLSRTVIDVNRDPSGVSLYPGRPTTELCPTTTFDGDALYREGAEPDATERAARLERYFAPYHGALARELVRLRERHGALVLYDCHSIRSRIPRLFAGDLPHLNLGTNAGASCAPELARALGALCRASRFESVIDGRFKGGYITRHYGRPAEGLHAVQMELACRAYLPEQPGPVEPRSWPPPYDPAAAEPLRGLLRALLAACLDFAARAPSTTPYRPSSAA
ncbi:MAG TPA: N-formylglutamate deformylase [Steroidobacteraceae bacterium]|nr:N-formylglutamate deformylase [Steroidobacteraceae bacterium]